MEGRLTAGVLVVSIDLELEIDDGGGDREERLDAIGSRLLSLTQQHGVAATWAVADPLLSAATDAVLRAGGGHELAVLGDRTWIDPASGRARIARELDRRFGRARTAGIPVATLALRNVEPAVLDLLHDHGVTAVRGPAVDSLSLARKVGAGAVRLGVWQTPTPWRYPTRSHWWYPASWRLCREIRRLREPGTMLHLAIDAPRLIDAGPEGLATLSAALSLACKRRDSGQLHIATLGQLAELALRERAVANTRSILRAAA